MKTRELLEKDKERLLARLGSADTPDQTVAALEDELSRIQIQYGEQVTDENLSREASYALQTAKAAISLVDSTGEVRTYERTNPSGKKSNQGKYLIPLATGIGTGAVGCAVLTMVPSSLMIIGIILVFAGIALTFAGGYNFGRRKLTPDKAEQYIDVRMDSDNIYRNLGAMLTVVDHNLEDARLVSMESPEVTSSPDDVDDDELRLLASILETAYSSEDSDENRQTISDITFYLHRRGIEVVTYREETAKYFNRMPAVRTSTLKPALVRDNVVLIRGMAAVKSS